MFITSLKNQKEFELVNNTGKKFHCSYFIAIITKDFPQITCNIQPPRSHSPGFNNNIFYFGMKVGKKLSKSAVTRNKIKRRIRHLIRLLTNVKDLTINNNKNFLKSTIALHNWGVIIIPRKGFEKFEFSTLLQEIRKIFLKL